MAIILGDNRLYFFSRIDVDYLPLNAITGGFESMAGGATIYIIAPGNVQLTGSWDAYRLYEDYPDNKWGSGALGNSYYVSQYDITVAQVPQTLNSPIAGGVTVIGTSLTDMYIKARDYFDTPTAPYMDISVYTEGNTRNTAYITLIWDNIQNIPTGMYPASYQVRIQTYVVSGHMSQVAYVPYTTKQYRSSYNSLLYNLSEAEQDDAIINGRLWIQATLGHNEGETWVEDAVYKFRVEDTAEVTDETGGETGGDVIINNHIPPSTNDSYNDDDGSLDPQAPGQALSVDNLLYTSYALTEGALVAFGRYMWTNDLTVNLYANQTAPIENILACKRIPFDVNVVSGNASIKIGNIDTGIGSTISPGEVHVTNATHLQDCGSITIPTFNGGNWIDMLNKYSIYLPYCGIHALPTDALLKQVIDSAGLPRVAGRTLAVKYYYDIIYGTCIAEVSIDGNAMFIFNGECGVDIPITASNRATNQLAMIKGGENTILSGVSNVVGGIISGAGGGLIGAAVGGLVGVGKTAMNVAHEEVNRQTAETHYTTSGGFSSQVASYLSSTITLFCEHMIYTEPTSYAKENGYPCYLDRNLSELEGYTELDGSIEIDGIPALEEEKILLKQALMEGFYL